MPITIHCFGQITDITGAATIAMDSATDVATLRLSLLQRFPALAAIPFLVAVDQTVAPETAPVPDHAVVALLPPFSGG